MRSMVLGTLTECSEYHKSGLSLLWLGAGEIAHIAQKKLLAMGLNLTYASRSYKQPLDDAIQFRQVDFSLYDSVVSLNTLRPDICVCTFSPKGRGEEAYQIAYRDSLKHILKLFSDQKYKPKLLIFVSSTSIYEHAGGERVNEKTPVQPETMNGQIMHVCEQMLERQSFPTCALRFSGIYGAKRYHLLNRTKSGISGGPNWTNRIHIEDCAGVISFLVSCVMAKKKIPNCLLASDDTPIKSNELGMWLAKKLQVKVVSNSKLLPRVAGIGKRCDNTLLKSLGYMFQYPSYKEGFPLIISEYLNECED